MKCLFALIPSPVPSLRFSRQLSKIGDHSLLRSHSQDDLACITTNLQLALAAINMNHNIPASQFLVLLLAAVATSPALADRTTRSLAGDWLFQRSEAGSDWKTVSLPANFEEHEGTDFDGIGTYKKQIPSFELPQGMRAILHFQAVATLAEVTFNGQEVGNRTWAGGPPFVST